MLDIVKWQKNSEKPNFFYILIIFAPKFYEVICKKREVDIIGPSEYYVSFINGKYRRKFLLKYYNFQDIKEVLIEFKNYILSISKLNLQINIDPYEDF